MYVPDGEYVCAITLQEVTVVLRIADIEKAEKVSFHESRFENCARLLAEWRLKESSQRLCQTVRNEMTSIGQVVLEELEVSLQGGYTRKYSISPIRGIKELRRVGLLAWNRPKK